MHRTDTKINTSISDYKIFTDEIYNKLVENIDEFNKISKVAYIYSIEKDFENNMIHINFYYFGSSKPNGLALKTLIKLCEFSSRLYFIHFFYDSKNKRKEYLSRPEIKQRYNELQKKNNKKPKNRERIKKYNEEYQKKYYSIEENKAKRRKYLKEYEKNTKRKEYKSELQKIRNQNPDFKRKHRYLNYLNDHNLTQADLSLEEYEKLRESFLCNKRKMNKKRNKN